MTAHDFLNGVWTGGLEGDAHLLIWTLPDRKSRWFNDLDVAAAAAVEASIKGADVYVQVGVASRNLGPGRRAKREEVVAIPGVWCELDIKTDDRDGFRDEDAALHFLQQAPLPPTVLIHSGGGIHCWWLFKEPWWFSDGGEREQAAHVVHGWWRHLADKAQAADQSIDSVWDMSRILRIPETKNTKYDREVRVIQWDDGNRINQADLEVYSRKPPMRAHAGGGDFVVEPKGYPPVIKLQALFDEDAEFKRSFLQRIPTSGMQDDSLSAFDLSHCTKAVLAGWDPWEDCPSLITSFRQAHGTPEDQGKGRRRSYVLNTILRAMDALELQAQREDLATRQASDIRNVQDMIEGANGQPIEDREQRQKVWDMVRSCTTVDLDGITQYGKTTKAVFVLRVKGLGEVRIGSADDLITAKTWKSRLLTMGKGVSLPKPPIWSEITQAIAKCIDVVDELELEEAARVRGYLAELAGERRDKSATTLREGWAFLLDDRLHFTLRSLAGRAAIHEQISDGDLRMSMSLLGASKANTVAAHDKETQKSVSRSYYSIPLEALTEQKDGEVLIKPFASTGEIVSDISN